MTLRKITFIYLILQQYDINVKVNRGKKVLRIRKYGGRAYFKTSQTFSLEADGELSLTHISNSSSIRSAMPER